MSGSVKKSESLKNQSVVAIDVIVELNAISEVKPERLDDDTDRYS